MQGSNSSFSFLSLFMFNVFIVFLPFLYLRKINAYSEKMRGKFIVIEGLDGSGKSTQVALLQQKLLSLSIPSEFIHFPRTNTESPYFGELIGSFLRGELGSLDQVNPYLVALLFAGDRKNAAQLIEDKLNNGIWIIADRYVLSNIAYQGAKCKSSDESETLARWILNLEYQYFSIPKPDINIFLKVPQRFAENNIKSRSLSADRDYLNGVDDIHEIDFDFQDKVAKIYQQMLLDPSFYGLDLVDLSIQNDASFPSPDEVSAIIQKKIFQ